MVLKRMLLTLLILTAFARATEYDQIVRVAFRGNEFFSDDTLRTVFGVREEQYVSSRRVYRGRENLLELYRQNGFADAEVSAVITERYGLRGGTVVCVDIAEGPPTLVESVSLRYNGIVEQADIDEAVGFEKADVWTLAYSDAIRLNLIHLYAEHGYLYAKVEVVHSIEDGLASLTATVDEGPRVRVAGVDLTGYEPVIERVIRREIVIQPGDWFKASDVFTSQRNIYSTGIFTNVGYTIVGKDERKTEVRILFELEPDKTSWVGFKLGYTYSGSIGSGLRFEAAWGDDNLWGNLQRLEIGANFVYAFKTRWIEEDLYQIIYREPWFLSVRDLSARLRIFFERERRISFNVDSFGGDVSLEQRFYLWLTGALGFRYERVNLWEYDNPDLPQEEGYSSTSALFTRAGIDTRDNPLNPRSGIYFLSYGEYAGGFMGGDNDFYKLSVDLSGHVPLGRNVSIALHGYFALADAHHDTTILPVYERFYTGGAYSVRGFGERSLGPRDARGNSLGGVTSLVGNLEFRISIPGTDLAIGLFVDTGMAWGDVTGIDIEDLAVGVGGGLRYITPIGPIRLDVGFVVVPGVNETISPYSNEGYTVDTDNWELHLAIGNIF